MSARLFLRFGGGLGPFVDESFARGAYSDLLVNRDRARRQLAKALGRTLFFAGEATDEEDAGTVAGALNSGKRAAREVLSSFRNAK